MKQLRRYKTEIIFTAILFIWSIGGYWVFLQYQYREIQQVQLQQLETDINRAKRQIIALTQVTPEEKKQWQRIREDFLSLFPPPTDLPSQYTYNTENQTFHGQGVPLDVTRIPLYRLINQISTEMGLRQINVTYHGSTASPMPVVKDHLKIAQLQITFVSQYRQVFQMLQTLTQQPIVLEVKSLKLSPANKTTETLQVDMKVHYFYRNSETMFEGWQ